MVLWISGSLWWKSKFATFLITVKYTSISYHKYLVIYCTELITQQCCTTHCVLFTCKQGKHENWPTNPAPDLAHSPTACFSIFSLVFFFRFHFHGLKSLPSIDSLLLRSTGGDFLAVFALGMVDVFMSPLAVTGVPVSEVLSADGTVSATDTGMSTSWSSRRFTSWSSGTPTLLESSWSAEPKLYSDLRSFIVQGHPHPRTLWNCWWLRLLQLSQSCGYQSDHWWHRWWCVIQQPLGSGTMWLYAETPRVWASDEKCTGITSQHTVLTLPTSLR